MLSFRAWKIYTKFNLPRSINTFKYYIKHALYSWKNIGEKADTNVYFKFQIMVKLCQFEVNLSAPLAKTRDKIKQKIL